MYKPSLKELQLQHIEHTLRDVVILPATAMLKPKEHTVPRLNVRDEYNDGIDLSEFNQALVMAELKVDKAHHLITYEEWSNY